MLIYVFDKIWTGLSTIRKEENADEHNDPVFDGRRSILFIINHFFCSNSAGVMLLGEVFGILIHESIFCLISAWVMCD